jgi:hypothetical protein
MLAELLRRQVGRDQGLGKQGELQVRLHVDESSPAARSGFTVSHVRAASVFLSPSGDKLVSLA